MVDIELIVARAGVDDDALGRDIADPNAVRSVVKAHAAVVAGVVEPACGGRIVDAEFIVCAGLSVKRQRGIETMFAGKLPLPMMARSSPLPPLMRRL